jgi:hypothetical protein
MRKYMALAGLMLLAGASAHAGVIRLAAKAVKHAPHAAVKVVKSTAKAAYKVAI